MVYWTEKFTNWKEQPIEFGDFVHKISTNFALGGAKVTKEFSNVKQTKTIKFYSYKQKSKTQAQRPSWRHFNGWKVASESRICRRVTVFKSKKLWSSKTTTNRRLEYLRKGWIEIWNLYLKICWICEWSVQKI